MRQVALYKNGKYATSIEGKHIVFDADTSSAAMKMSEMEMLVTLDKLRDVNPKATDGSSIVYLSERINKQP